MAEIDLRRFLDEMKKAPGRCRPGAFFIGWEADYFVINF